MFGIKRLKARIAGLENDLRRADANYSTAQEKLGQANHALLKTRGDHLAEENTSRSLRGQLVAMEHDSGTKDATIRHLNGQISGRQSLNKALAAERDEAVLRARTIDQRYAACQNKLAEAQIALRGAMVRDAKGRLTKWISPSEKTITFENGSSLHLYESDEILRGPR